MHKDTCSVLTSTVCAPCDCDTKGSASVICDQSGKCTCKGKYYGDKCNNRDCEMTSWSAWNTTCRCGYTDPKSRTRSVHHQAEGDGNSCPPAEETTNCIMESCDCADKPGYYGDRCDKRDCQLASWSSWSACLHCSDRMCYMSNNAWICPDFVPEKTRSRSVKTSKKGGGKACTGDRQETNSCGYTCTKDCSLDAKYCWYVKK